MLSNNLLQARLPMQCICVTSSEAATVNENLHSLGSTAKMWMGVPAWVLH